MFFFKAFLHLLGRVILRWRWNYPIISQQCNQAATLATKYSPSWKQTCLRCLDCLTFACCLLGTHKCRFSLPVLYACMHEEPLIICYCWHLPALSHYSYLANQQCVQNKKKWEWGVEVRMLLSVCEHTKIHAHANTFWQELFRFRNRC